MRRADGVRRARRLRSLRAVAVSLAVAAAAAGIPCARASAHSRSLSFSSWELDGASARVVLRLAQLELTRLPWGPVAAPHLDAALGAYLTGHLTLRSGAEPCSVSDGPRALAAPAGNAVVEWRLECPAADDLAIHSALFREVAPSHLHFGRVHASGSPVLERVLSSADATWVLERRSVPEAGAGAGGSLASYVSLGIEHIFTGYDHLAFLLALVLLARRLGEVAVIATGFTVAHSLTLALAVLGSVRPQAQTVEALIGLSIALVAAENAWWLSGRRAQVPQTLCAGLLLAAALALAGVGAPPAATLFGLAMFSLAYFRLLERVRRPPRLRAAIAFVFGLVHGFGFAGVLAELALPKQRLAPALLGFNVGVELGQLAVLALLWPFLLAASRLYGGRPHRGLVEFGSAAVCGLGLFWFVTRAYG